MSKTKNIYFLSKNIYKIKEIKYLFRGTGISPYPINESIDEIQTEDVDKLLRDKILSAFRKIKAPVFVDHTSLRIQGFAGLPGGLTQIFWDRLKEERFAEFFGKMMPNSVVASTDIAYCDGKKIHNFHGEIEGKISIKPQGPTGFQWDCVFIPNGEEKTFAELGIKKNDISMRRKAFDDFLYFLKNGVYK